MVDARAPRAVWRTVRGLPEFRRLLELRAVSQFGDGLFQAGLAGALLFNPERAADPWAIAGAFAVLIVVSFITFVIFQLAPLLSHSSPVYYYVGKIPFPPGSLQLKLLEHKYGFDLPWYQQYWHWLHGIFFGQVLSDGTTLVYRTTDRGVSYTISDTNSSGSGEVYCYSSAIGGQVAESGSGMGATECKR